VGLEYQLSSRWVRRRWGAESAFWRGLFEWRGGFAPRSEFPSHLDSVRKRRDHGNPASELGWRGRARARMVLGPFAETKGPRRCGVKTPQKPFLIVCHPEPAAKDLNFDVAVL
jgi:hypothetical protein